VGTASAKASAAIEEATKLRKWQEWAKASEVTALQGELDVVRQERDMLQRDLQARLAEMRRVTTTNEEHTKDLKALRADLFAREGRLGRVEAELAALQRSAQQVEIDLTVSKEQLERRKEELAKASMDNVKLRGQFESEKLRWQNTVNTIRATQQTDEEKARNQHAREMEASRRDAQAAWRLAKELEQRVLQQAQLFANNKASLSSAMNDARKIMADVAPNSPALIQNHARPVASKDRMEAIQAQLSAATLERDALKREVLAQRTPTAVEAQPAAIAAAVRPNVAAAAVTAAAVNKFKGRS
jgi:chromosome segregation ATPase